MKRFLIIFLFSIICVLSYGQSWNTIEHDMQNCISVKTDYDPYRIHGASDTKYMPSVVYNRYQFGEKLAIGGWINLGLGGVCSIIGGTLIGTSDSKIGINTGYALLGVGGAMVSVSIPLLCFGDAAKREANVDYEVFNLHYKK